jgi:SAM-dependent methyltransferase
MVELREDAGMDDTHIYDHYIAARASAALAVAVHTGFLTWLTEGPRTATEVGARFGWRPRPTDSFLTALTAMKILHRVKQPDPGAFFQPEDTYALTPEADAFLVPGRPEDLSGLIAMEFESFITPAGLLQAMERDAPQVYGASNPWATHEADRERARAFARAMRSISARPAHALVRLPLLAGRKHLLDVGGGSGIFAVACLKAWPDLSATVLEIPSVWPLAEELAREEGVEDRLRTVAADMFRDPWPAGADTILLSQILHDWRPEQGAELVRCSFEALPPGGLLLVHEKLLDAERREPLANALVGIDMLFWTEGQQYSEAQLRSLLEAARFRQVETARTSGYWTVTSAHKG